MLFRFLLQVDFSNEYIMLINDQIHDFFIIQITMSHSQTILPPLNVIWIESGISFIERELIKMILT